MDKRLFKQGDEVTLVSGEFIDQLGSWKNNKALVSHDQNENEEYVHIRSENSYSNSYPAEDLRLITENKMINKNKDFIKKHNKKKNFTTTYLIQNFILITKDNNEQ